MTEMYKIVNGIAPPIMNSLFNFNFFNIHNIRNFQKIFTENRKTVKYGIHRNSDVSSTVSLGESSI